MTQPSQEIFSSLIEYCQSNGRVCPMLPEWHQLWEMLPEKQRVGAGWAPSLPLILAAWGEPAILKMIRLKEHLEWANDHGTLAAADSFLRGLSEDRWFHLKD